MCIRDSLLILLIGIHQVMDVHFLKSSAASEKRQQVTACIACGSHQNAVSVELQMEVVFHLDHAVENGHDDLLKQSPKMCIRDSLESIVYPVFKDSSVFIVLPVVADRLQGLFLEMCIRDSVYTTRSAETPVA